MVGNNYRLSRYDRRQLTTRKTGVCPEEPSASGRISSAPWALSRAYPEVAARSLDRREVLLYKTRRDTPESARTIEAPRESDRKLLSPVKCQRVIIRVCPSREERRVPGDERLSVHKLRK